MKTASGELNPAPETKARGKTAWPLSRWLLLIALVLAAHLALIFAFGTRKPITPRVVTNVPELALAGGPSEWLTLDNPTLFALPSREGFAGPAWLEPPRVEFHRKAWAARPLPLQLPIGELGASFSRFMQTNRFVAFQFKLEPPPQFTVPLVPLEPALVTTSTLRIEGNLARRPLQTSMSLPSWPDTELLKPSKVQVLVNMAGEVVSTILLSPSGDDTADRRAMTLARAARFAPASSLTVGQLIFDWHTIAPAATNALSGS